MSNCSTKVYPPDRWGAFHPHPCGKKEWKDGYCKIHHPESVEQRRKKSQERFDARIKNPAVEDLERALAAMTAERDAARVTVLREVRDEIKSRMIPGDPLPTVGFYAIGGHNARAEEVSRINTMIENEEGR